MNRRERRRAAALSRPVAEPIGSPEAARVYHDAVQHLKSGRLAESEVAHRRVLSLVPNHAQSLHHLGIIAYQRREMDGAVDFIRKSLSAKPDYHEAWLNLAIVLNDMSRAKEAIEACRQSLALYPRNAQSHAVLGNLLRVAQNDVEAMAAYVSALELNPEQPLVLVYLALLFLKSGQTEQAVAHCKRALELDPGLEEARSLDRRLSAISQSLETLIRDIERQSQPGAERAKRFDDLATTLRDRHRYADSATLCRRAIVEEPAIVDYHFNLALSLEGMGRGQDAIAAYQTGLAFDPSRADAYAGLGALLRSMNMHKGAIQALEHAVKLDPKLSNAWYNLAVTHKLQDNYEEARAAFEKCIECEPDAIVNRFEYINLRRVLCDWDGIEAEEKACLETFRVKTVNIAPFPLISLWATPADQLRAAQGYVQTFDVPASHRIAEHRSRRAAGQRIRLGFVSCDFFQHATAMLFSEVLEKLDRSRFEIFGYCHSPDDNSPMRERLIRAFEHFRRIGPMRNRDVAHAIEADGIDVLVDLKGYTRDSRSQIFAYRPAPIQVNYLGYPGTMGADFIDYVVADAIVAPTDAQEYFSERIVHLPNSYQPNDRQRIISEEPVTRAEHGLPEDAFVFCSFNNSYKLNATMFDIWMPLLQKVAGSALWLLVPNETCANNLRREAEVRGVDPARLVFAERTTIDKHLARHRLADLFLDALPCNAHTTTSDALWMGLPVVTCLGETFAGRVAGSLLSASGVPELVTSNLDDYAKLALELAENRPKLEAMRSKIIAQRDAAPLFDSTRYTRNLESAFQTMVDIMRSGEAPRAFTVSE